MKHCCNVSVLCLKIFFSNSDALCWTDCLLAGSTFSSLPHGPLQYGSLGHQSQSQSLLAKWEWQCLTSWPRNVVPSLVPCSARRSPRLRLVQAEGLHKGLRARWWRSLGLPAVFRRMQEWVWRQYWGEVVGFLEEVGLRPGPGCSGHVVLSNTSAAKGKTQGKEGYR